MTKRSLPDLAVLKLPSLRAIKIFLVAAKHQNFTRAAEALCVTQAAVSRQIRDLEEDLGTDLFVRSGRSIELTRAGHVLFDAVQLSLGNISRATDRIRGEHAHRNSVTLCCSPAFSRLWIAPRIGAFQRENPDIDVNIVATHNVLSFDPGTDPDLLISKWKRIQDGYSSQALISDVIYPVCSPSYLAKHPEVATLEGIRDSSLLTLSPYGRSQVDEHVDWSLWLTYHDVDWRERDTTSLNFVSNDYGTLVEMALSGEGITLGWNHLVGSLVEEGRLIKPVKECMVLPETVHYLAIREERKFDERCQRLHKWLTDEFAVMRGKLNELTH